LVTYSGNAGRAHTFSSVLSAARELASDNDVVFLFIGGGARFEELRSAARDSGLANMRFLGYVPRDQLRYSLSAASVSLVTENPEVSGLLVPSKTYGILASGRPVIYVGPDNSDVAQIIHDYDCGVVVSPDDPAALVAAIRKFRSDAAYRERLGRNARSAAETVFDRSIAAAQWSEKLAQLRAPQQRKHAAREQIAAGAGSSI
ncbi:MAG TPA: glycosyltransferase family 4 protein, partial [Longimicrobiales bacterium]